MLVVTRFSVAVAESERFAERAGIALEVLAACPGYLRGRLGRAPDEPTSWLLLTEWDGVGSYRRALSAYDVRVHATPLLADADRESSAFEVLLAVDHPGAGIGYGSDRAADADTTGPGQPVAPAPRHGQPTRAAAPEEPGMAGQPPAPGHDHTGQETP